MKELKDYLHLLIGCHGDTWTLMANDTFSMHRVEILTPELYAGVMRGVNKFQPHLRLLPDMTEEERVNAVNPMLYGLNHTLDHMKIYQSAELVEFLLSKHFDLFGLIESGLAIDKTTLQQ